ncbi:flagellar brake protein [Chitinilyticum piscinae]|uniref:Flagellar brake protein YcgR n=1 Tax=Chitinilyticum piscinae TaxID=2866724 RepID=A0A8J7FNN2_9NEIS|nr:flagellar brake protein [Chitinilyticum piscinae]MBE9610126.1 flagellar brake protein [Chitinilyticum piscinae]
MSTSADHSQPIPSEIDISPFVQQAPLAIGYELRQLAAHNVPIAVYFNNGQGMMITRVLDVDNKAREFIFDLAGHEPTNAALSQANRILLVAAPEGVKVQFTIQAAKRCTFEGKPAFVAPFPVDLIKLQRREYFRLPTPLANPYRCSVMLPDGRKTGLELHDLSLGGFGCWVPDGLQASFEPGSLFPEAWFEMGPLGQLKLAFEVRSLRELDRGNVKRWFVGAKFDGLSRNAEAAIQRLLVQLERDRKALLG